MANVSFNRSSTLAQAKMSQDYDVIYFPTDSDAIVMGRKEYGCNASVLSQLSTLSSQVTSAVSTAEAAEADASAANTTVQSVLDILDNINSGGVTSSEGTALATELANKATVVNVSNVNANDTIADYPERCVFNYGGDVVTTTSSGHSIYVCKGIPGSSSAIYWEFVASTTACSGRYTNSNVPSSILGKFLEVSKVGKYGSTGNYAIGQLSQLPDYAFASEVVIGYMYTSEFFRPLDQSNNLLIPGISDYFQDDTWKVTPSTSKIYFDLSSNIWFRWNGTSYERFLIMPSLNSKAARPSSSTNGDLAGLDSNGNLTDSGFKASDLIQVGEVVGTVSTSSSSSESGSGGMIGSYDV